MCGCLPALLRQQAPSAPYDSRRAGWLPPTRIAGYSNFRMVSHVAPGGFGGFLTREDTPSPCPAAQPGPVGFGIILPVSPSASFFSADFPRFSADFFADSELFRTFAMYYPQREPARRTFRGDMPCQGGNAPSAEGLTAWASSWVKVLPNPKEP